MVLFRDKMSRKIFAFFVIYLFFTSLMNIQVKAQPTPASNINWNDTEKVKEALKKNPSLIGQNFESAQIFIRNNKQFVLENPEIAYTYLNVLGKITDPADRSMAQEFLSKTTKKNFDLSQGTVEVQNRVHIIDEKGKKFSIEAVSYTHLTLPTTPYV